MFDRLGACRYTCQETKKNKRPLNRLYKKGTTTCVQNLIYVGNTRENDICKYETVMGNFK